MLGISFGVPCKDYWDTKGFVNHKNLGTSVQDSGF